MKTDKQFYTLFKEIPERLMELSHIRVSCKYELESITLKETEHPLDGVLKPEKEDEPHYITEFQGYGLENIYQRTSSVIVAYRRQYGIVNVKGMIIFTDKPSYGNGNHVID